MQGGWNACAPIGWLRSVTEAATDSEGKPVKFYYDSASAYIKSPRELNKFKAGMNERGIYEMSPIRRRDSSLLIGDTLSADDEMYIKNSSELIENLVTYSSFQLPFFGVVVTIIALITFLSLRSYRRDIAIASSLGRQKLLNAAVPFFSTLIVQALGCFFCAFSNRAYRRYGALSGWYHYVYLYALRRGRYCPCHSVPVPFRHACTSY